MIYLQLSFYFASCVVSAHGVILHRVAPFPDAHLTIFIGIDCRWVPGAVTISTASIRPSLHISSCATTLKVQLTSQSHAFSCVLCIVRLIKFCRC